MKLSQTAAVERSGSEQSTTRLERALPDERIGTLALAGVLTGLAYTTLGLVSLGTTTTGAVLDGWLIFANVLEVFALFGLYLVYRDVAPRLGLASFALFAATTVANVAGTAAFVLEVDALVFLAFPVGVFGQFVAYLGFALITARTARLLRWTGSLLVLTFPAAIVIGRLTGSMTEFGDYPGAIGVGVIYLLVGTLVHRYARASVN